MSHADFPAIDPITPSLGLVKDALCVALLQVSQFQLIKDADLPSRCERGFVSCDGLVSRIGVNRSLFSVQTELKKGAGFLGLC